MKLTELFGQGKFVISSEVGPPKGIEVDKLLEEAELLRGKIDMFNVTDLQSSVMRLGALPTCHLLKKEDWNQFSRLPVEIGTALLCNLIFWVRQY